MLLRNIARRKLRTSLSILGIALSIGATVALLGISLGLVGQVSAVVSEAGSELTVVQRIPKSLTFGYLGNMPGEVVEGLRGLPGVARATPLVLARLFPPARRDGQGASFQASVGRVPTVLAVALASLVAVVVLGWTGVVAALAGLLAAVLLGWLLAIRLGGVTGDVLGAAVEVAELTVLLAGAAWAHGRL